MMSIPQKKHCWLGRGQVEGMESTFSVHATENLIYVKVRGQVTLEGLLDLDARKRSDPSYHQGMSGVCDFREAYGSWDYSEMQSYRDFLVHVAGTHKRRWAMVVKPGDLAALLHVTILISDQVQHLIQIQVFEEYEKAERWVRKEFD